MTIPKDKSRQSQEALKSQIVVTLQKKEWLENKRLEPENWGPCWERRHRTWEWSFSGSMLNLESMIIWVLLPPSHNAIITTRMTFIIVLGYPNLNRHLEPLNLLGRGTTRDFGVPM